MATIHKSGSKYVWTGTYAERMLPKNAGWRWDPVAKVWWTDQIGKVRPLAEYALDDVVADLQAQDAVVATSYASDLSQVASVHDAALLDRIATYTACDGSSLHAYQQAGVAQCLRLQRCLLGDDMGLGKTAQAIASADLAGHTRILIVCPAGVAGHWAREICRWTGDSMAQIVIAKGRKRSPLVAYEAASDRLREWAIVPYSVAQYRIADAGHPQVVIIDESHWLKNPKAKRTSAVVGGWDSRLKQAIPCVCDGADMVLALTGTPLPNRPVELQPVLTGALRVRWAFGSRYRNTYCGPQEVWTGSRYVTTYQGSTNREDLARKLRESCLLRRTKLEVLKDLPAKTVVTVELDAIDRKHTLTREQEAAIAAALACGTLPTFEGMSEIRREQACAKAPLAAAWIREQYAVERDAPEPVVVFCHHQDVVAAIAQDLSTSTDAPMRCGTITGATPQAERQAIIDAFKIGNLDAVIGSIGAMGTGVDGLQHRASHAVFVELDWVPGNVVQAEDRICRMGQTLPVTVTHLIMPGTMDVYMSKLVASKASTISEIMADDQSTLADGSAYGSNAKAPTPSGRREGLIDQDKAEVILHALRTLAGVCDGAASRDDMGFNGCDTAFGKSLAQRTVLTHRQAAAARKMLAKYRNTQLSGHPIWDLPAA